jgi:lactate permease
MILLSLAPILIFGVGLVTFRRHAFAVAAVSFTAAVLLALGVWQMLPHAFFVAGSKAVVIAAEISLILFGALIFLEVMRAERVLSSLEHYLEQFSKDIRVQVILLTWFFGAFLEGTAGFGIPALIIAPLLMHIGISARLSVVLALIGNTVPVSFGAVGTPVRIGLADFGATAVAQDTVFLGAMLSLFVPVIILAILTKGMGKSREFFTDGLPFALWSGTTFGVAYYFSQYLGQEFPTLFGSLFGLAATLIPLKTGMFAPKTTTRAKPYEPNERPLHIMRVLAPYLAVVSLLIAGRVVLPSFTLQLPLGETQILRFFNPGIAFLSVVLVYWIGYPHLRVEGPRLLKEATLRLRRPAILLLTTVGLVQVMALSGQNLTGYASMVSYSFQRLDTILLPVFSPVIGALGGFVAGSTTLSNLIFGSVQSQAALAASYSVSSILALQVLGATAGNSLALSNIVAASSSVGLHREEGHIVRDVFPWAMLYLAIIALAGVGLILIT